jgi:large subunit ribosomal protein L17
MRHRKNFNKLSRPSSHRLSMLRNLAVSLIKHERIITTVQKAKEARRIAERLITYGKRGTLHARRLCASIVQDDEVLKKIFGELAERYKNRNGGYTRITRIGFRRGDGAEEALFELVDRPLKESKEEKKK